MRRIVVVTGASHGIGRATALRLARAGDQVFACGRDGHALRSLCDEAGTNAAVSPLLFDIADSVEIVRATRHIAAIDVLITSAGVCRTARMDSPNAADVWREMLDINLHGVYYTIAAMLPKFNDSGRIVVVASGLGKLGRPGYGAYCASKHGLLGLMRCLSRELAPRGITVNAVCPGWVDTRMAHGDIGVLAAREARPQAAIYEEVVARIAIGRMVAADEVAALIEFLASPEAGALTGEAVNISGGEFFA